MPPATPEKNKAETDKAARAREIDKAVEFNGKGIVPKNLDQLHRYAQWVLQSGLAPKGLNNPAAIVVAIEHGLEIGLMPMQAVQSIAVINGRPSIYGDALLALIRSHPQCDDVEEWLEGEGENMVAHCRMVRRGKSTPVERTFSVADARKAKLWSKPGPWQEYPKRMLQMRARAWAGRDCFPDALKGIQCAEEAMDMPPRTVESRVFDPAQAKGGRTEALVEDLQQPSPPAHEEAAEDPTDEPPFELGGENEQGRKPQGGQE